VSHPVNHQEILALSPPGQGLMDITPQIDAAVGRSAVETGMVHLFIRHTSASLVIQENADDDVQIDLQNFLRRLVPEGDPLYRHTAEGPDDMPAHVKSALTATSLSIPARNGELLLGQWQAIYLWEHRRSPGRRSVVVHVAGRRG
jgi:secondary thiamine-phosphate synthase enzyme